jgi:hypothetical protein
VWSNTNPNSQICPVSCGYCFKCQTWISAWSFPNPYYNYMYHYFTDETNEVQWSSKLSHSVMGVRFEPRFPSLQSPAVQHRGHSVATGASDRPPGFTSMFSFI